MTKPTRQRRNPASNATASPANAAPAPVTGPTAEAEALPLLLLTGTAPPPPVPGFATLPLDLDNPPQGAEARAAVSPALALLAPQALRDRARAWADEAGLPDLPVIPAENAAAALPAALASRLAAAERDAGQARRSAALLRRETEAVNRRLHALERFMYSIGGPRLSQALNWPPTDAMISAPGGVTLVQRLPIDSPGIVAVELWLPEADEQAVRALSLAIEDSEGTQHDLSLDEISMARDDGWLRFSTEEPVAGDRQDCRLVIRDAPAELRIGLGAVVPDEGFALGGIEQSERSLALRVWRAVTGAAIDSAPPAIGRGRAQGSVASRLPPSALPRPSLLASPRSAADHVSTAFWAKEDAILVHPSARGPVCAILQRAPLEHVQRLSAVVQSARDDAPPLSFAVGVAPAGTITEDNWDDHLGAWVTLPPGAWGEVHAALAAPLPGRLCDIILATAVAGGAKNDNSWALFRGFRVVRKRPS